MKAIALLALVAIAVLFTSCAQEPEPGWAPSPPPKVYTHRLPPSEGHHGHNAFSPVYR